MAGWALDIAGRWKNRRVGGPGMRALAMAVLFLPVILVAMVRTRDARSQLNVVAVS